jgi:O-antigen/teichoic acid export membrane protein
VNAIANYLGRGWTTIIVLLCLPAFLLVLGREAYGLIGAFAVIQAWTLLLDFGLTPTLNREISRARAASRSWQSIANLLRSIEIVAVLVAVGVTLGIGLAAPFLSTTWLSPRQLSPIDVQHAITLMGVLAAVRWIEQVYRGAIQGTEDQVWLNGVFVVGETLRWGGGLAIVALVKPDVLLFFAWNLLVAIVSALLLRRRIRAFLQARDTVRARLDVAELRGVRSFAGGMFLSSLLTFLLTQADKLVVGSYVSLADFGLYSLAATAAAGLLQLVQPLTIAILPRFTTLVAAARGNELRAVFRAASEWMAVVVVPIGLTVLCLPERAMMAWTGQSSVVGSAAPILSLLMLASLLNALANVPYALQLAHGWTSLTNILNGVLLLLMVPAMLWATQAAGAIGAAGVLAALNLVSLLLLSSLVLSRLLPDERLRWGWRTVLLPLLTGLVICLGFRELLPPVGGRLVSLAQLGAAYLGIALTMLLIMPHPRRMLVARLRRSPAVAH